jgi:hypothetical protein
VVSVQSMTHAQAEPYLELWRRDGEGQKNFWKTRKPQGKTDDKKEAATPPPGH